MKKVLLFIVVFLCFGNVVPNVNASKISTNISSKEDWNQDYYEYNGLKLRYHSNTINNFWYTGREYFYRDMDDRGNWIYKKSDDMVEWEVMAQTSGLTELNRFSTYSYSINYWGDKYVIFNRLNEWNADAMQGAEHGYSVNKPLLILDSDFNLLSQQIFDTPITYVSYVNGKYYAETKDYSKYKMPYDFEPDKKVYVSEDAITWTEDNTFTEVPIGNGKNKTLR